ncbi:hypothetical protein PTKIN_Ptkin17bG0079200 [Pterospermum kingtungense]
MIDTDSEGALMNKTLEEARNLIANMAANSQQFENQLDMPAKPVNDVNISSIEQQIASLTSLICSMVVVVNLKENVSVMFLRSGKEVENSVKSTPEPSKTNKEQNIIVDKDTPIDSEAPKGKSSSLPEYKPVPLSLRL